MAVPNPTKWLVPFSWHGVDAFNNPALGKLVCTPRALQIASYDDTDPIRVYTAPQTFDIVNGVCTGSLLATDYPDNSNQGFTWNITEEITNGVGTTFDVEVPIGLQSTGILLSNIAPTYPTTGMPAPLVSYEMYAAQQAQIDELTAALFPDNDSVTYDYEDAGKLPGDPVTTSPGVIAVSGTPVYSAAAGLHLDPSQEGQGGIAMGVDGSDNGATLQYRVPNGSGGTGQLYFKMLGPIAPANPAQIWRTRDATDTTLLRLQVLASGKICLFDSTSTPLGPKCSHILVPNEWNRVDWMISLGQFGPQLEWRFFYGSNVESLSAGDSMSWPLLGTPAKYTFGNPGGVLAGGVRMMWDTLSMSSSSFSWPNPVAPVEGVPGFIWGSAGPGINTSTEVIVPIQYAVADAGKQVILARSTSPLMTSPTFYSNQTIGVDGTAIHGHIGLTAGTQYYFQPATANGHQLFGEVIAAKTGPALSGPWSAKWHLGSCLVNATSHGEIAAADVAAWGPDGNVLTGDDGYWGGSISRSDPYTKDLGKYIAAYGTKFPIMRHVVQSATAIGRCISDHELYDNTDYNTTSGQPGDGDHFTDLLLDPGTWPNSQGPGIHNSIQSQRELIAWQKIMPIAAWGDTRNPRRHRGYAYNWGSKIKVIVLDFRSPDRSNTFDPDGPAKTAFGGVQLDWFFSQLDPHRLNVLVFESSWSGDVSSINPQMDKMQNYAYERDVIAARLMGTDDNGIRYQCAMLGGDRHFVAFFDHTKNPYGDFPVWIGSGWEKGALALYPGETPTWGFGWVDNAAINQTVIGYMQIVIADDGANHISITGTARVVDVANDPTLTIKTPSGMSSTVTWTIT